MLSFTVVLALALSAFAAPHEMRQSCADVTVYFARDTGEIGTLGTIVGPPFRLELQSALRGKTLEFVGINYAASVAGFLAGGDPAGATAMANSITSKTNSCPNTKIVISGYSQGAQVTHLAAGKLSSAVQDRVNAAVVCGDPMKGRGFPSAISGHSKTFCALLDNICAGGVLITASHLGYGADADEAAAFVVSRI